MKLILRLIIPIMEQPGNVQARPPQRRERLALWLLALLLLVPALACNAFAGNLMTPVPAAPGGGTAVPTSPPTPTEGEVRLTVLVDLNVRSGPGVQYQRLSYLPEGATAVITGRNPEGDWWQIICPADVSTAECWVAGGPQFVSVPAGAAVPSVATPPPPTPAADDSGADGWLAYVNAGQLMVAALELSQEQPGLAVSPLRLTDGAAVTDFTFSPDGRYIAYLSAGEQANTLHVVSLDGREPRQLVSSRALPLAAGRDASRFAVLIDRVQWFPDSAGLAFNTTLANLSGPGRQSQEDLWAVGLDGDLRELFAPGLGGGSFLLLDMEQALLGKTDAIAHANLVTSATTVALTFARVNTASEYAFYPRLQQTAAGVYTAIPAPDPWQDGALTSLWEISATGTAVRRGQLIDVLLTEPVVWSDDGARLAFIQRATAGGPGLPRLVLADGAGTRLEPYTGGEGLAFFDWSPDSDAFLYAGAGFYARGQAGAPPQQWVLAGDEQADTAVWLFAQSFLVSTGSAAEGRWHIRGVANGTAEAQQSLVTLTGAQAPFAVWLRP